MRNRKYKLSLRRVSKWPALEEDLVIEVEDVEEIKREISKLGVKQKLFLCLGPYDVGAMNTYAQDFVQFEGVFGILSYSDADGSGFIMDDGMFKVALSQEMTLNEFIELVISQYYDVEVVQTANRAWHLLQEGWKCASRLKMYLNPMFTGVRNYTNEERLIFIKNRKVIEKR